MSTILAAIFILAGTFINAIATLWNPNERKKFITKVMLAGAVIGLLGGLLALYNQVLAEKEVHRLNQRIISQVTGGSSFCFVSFVFDKNEKGPYQHLLLISKGNYPMYDVQVQISNIRRNTQHWIKNDIKQASITDIVGNTKVIKVGNIPPNTSRFIGRYRVGDGPTDLVISMPARNGFFKQFLKARKINKTWAQAIRVWNEEDRETILFEQTHPEYPLKNGKVEWKDFQANSPGR